MEGVEEIMKKSLLGIGKQGRLPSAGPEIHGVGKISGACCDEPRRQ